MNGGNKLYIYKDGFGDVYNATAEEEAEWSQLVVNKALHTLETEENAVNLRFAIDNLKFHNYNGWQDLVTRLMKNTTSTRKKAFADALAGVY